MAKLNFVFRPFSTYDDIKGKLGTGDIVLFSGDTASGDIIKVATRSEFSHIAIVLDNNGTLVTLEATTNLANLRDLLTNNTGPGVRSFNLHDKIFAGTYNTIAIRQANFNISDLESTALRNFGNSLKGASYDSNPEDLIQPACNDYGTQVTSLIPLCNQNAGDNTYEDMGSFFCSEFVAKALINMSLLSSSKNPALYTPVDFASTAPVPLELLIRAGGYSLETYIFINLPQPNTLLTFLVGVWYFVFAVSILTVVAGVMYIILALARGMFSQQTEMPDPIEEDSKSNTSAAVIDIKKESMRLSKNENINDSKKDTKRDSLAPVSEPPKSKLKPVTQDVELGLVAPRRLTNTEPPASTPNFSSTTNSFSTNKSANPPKSVQL